MGCIQSKSLRVRTELPPLLPAAARSTPDQPTAGPLQRLASLPLVASPTAPSPALEAPEARTMDKAFAGMVRRVLGEPSTGYQAVVPKRLRDATAALAVLTDPDGSVGHALLAKASAEGWAACVRDHGATLASKRQGYGLGPLDGLLYRGAITPHEYWTASILFALWRDSQPPAMRAGATLGEPGAPVAFGGRYTQWDSVRTFDLTVTAQRGQALRRGYSLGGWTQVQHADSVAAAAASWGDSSERFMYLVPMQREGTYPWFGLAPFLSPGLTPWSIDLSRGEHLPVFSLSVFQHDLNFFYKQPLVAVPRLGIDPVSALQQQVLSGTRAAGISHGFPWSDRHKHLHADFLPTGEAGFAWHDLAHLNVGSVDAPEVRRTLVRLHQELSAHSKQLQLPETIGRFPFRKLFVARLFGLTDQSKTVAGMPAALALESHTHSIVGESLDSLLLSTNAARAANVHSNFLAHLPAHYVFHAGADPTLRAEVRENVGGPLKWHKDADVPRLAASWSHFTQLQVEHSNRWLQQRGYVVEAEAEEQAPLLALITHRQPHAADDQEAPLYNGAISLVRDCPVFGGEYRATPFRPVPFTPAVYTFMEGWKRQGR